MGDGGVACIPAHDIMVKFPVVSDSFCGGGGSSGGGSSNVNNNNSSSNSNNENESNGKLVAKPGTKRMKLKRDAFFKKEEPLVQVKKDEVGGQTGENEEVEEGELGTMISPKKEMPSIDGPSTMEKVLKGGSEKGEVDAVKDRKVEQVNGKVLPAKKRKGKAKKKGKIGTGSLRSDAVTRRERTPDFQWRRERSPDFVPRRKRSPEFSWRRERSPSFNAGWRNRSPDKYSKGISKRDEALSPAGADDDEIEREFIPDEFHNGELLRDDHSNNHRRDGSRDSDRRNALDYTPPPGKYLFEDISPGRKSGNQHRKRPARSEAHQDKNHLKMNLKVDGVSSYKNDPNHGNNHGKEHSSSASRLKRHDTDSDGDGRKHYEDHSDYVSSKSRRLSGDSFRSARTEHLSNRSVESSGKDPPSSRINSERQSLRRYDSYSSRTNDSHGRSSPYRSERSPHDGPRYRDHRERTPVTRERSPDRGGRNHYHRNQTPNNSTRSPESGPRAHDLNQSPSVLEGSQHDRKRSNNSDQATSSQLESKETRQNQISLEKEVKDRDTNRRSSVSAKEPESGRNLDNGSVHKNLTCHADKESHHEIPSIPSVDQHLLEDGAIEELPSMEEDMDICDTPPHVPAAVSIDPGKWFYLDYFGVERGPSRLCDLKTLVDGGFLATDHFIKHIDSHRWMTVENAASPLVTLNFSTVVSDDVSQLVSPPEAAGNLLTDTMDAEHANDAGMVAPVALEQRITCSSENSDVSDVSVDLRIVERVDALMEDISILPGKELEILGEILKTTFSHPGHEIWNTFEDTGDTELFPRAEDLSEQNGDAPPGFPDKAPADAAEPTSSAGMDVDGGQLPAEFNEWFSCRWSCRGGDWRKNDDGVQDKYFKKKIVLNDGYPLCQMLKSENEDPRSSEIDDLYSTSQSSTFELPVWAFSWPDEQSDFSISGKPGQAKVALPKGVKGTMLPVVRINACVVNEHDSSSSDARLRNRGKDRYPSKFVRPCPSPGDNIRSNTEDSSHLNHRKDNFDCTPINVSKDHILTKDELQLHLGGWYFLDGAGRENGPFPLSQLHLLVDQGLIQKCSSVFRKIDNVWVPVTSNIGAFQNTNKLIEDHRTSVHDSSGALLYAEEGELHETNIASSSVHDTYPQFIGYTRGKLHELVMRFYKSREFAAAINEVLDPWINARQPKKESEKHPYLQKSALESESSLVHQGHLHAAKRAQLMAEGSGEEYEMKNNSWAFLDDVQPFEDLCGNVSFFKSKAACSKVMDGSWGLLDGHILARIFHFLRGDMRSLVYAYSTCKHWREAIGFYRGISRLVNLSSIGNKCTDSVFRSIMGGYDEGKIRSLVLVGCSNISSGILEDILSSFSCISFIDIRGCAQLDELTTKFSNLNWVTGHSVQSTGTFENSYFRIPSSKQMADEISSVSRSSISSSYMDDSSGLEVYFDMVDKKRDAANQAFRQSLYKRSKLYDARRSLSILAREAHMRRWAMKKPGNGYKRTEEFLLNSLKEITQDKTYEFFVPRVTEIEGRIKSGYYASRRIAYVKEDINKMCKDAKKMRNRDSGDMNHIIKMLNKLSAGLEANSRRVIDKDQMMKTLKDDSVGISKHKKHSKPKTDRKKMSRSNSSSITYGGPDYMEYSDRESGRRLSKSKLKSVESGTDSSDEFEASSDDAGSNSDSMGSETESDLDMRTDVGFGDSRAGYVISDEDSMTDDREWGARMTKASLVPPVTRKYEVIEEYVIVADEDEVSRKMRVSLPDDYDEKVKAQKNGIEESDMEIPEVKEFKPRKQLGDEVIEQEVFGIDPYTHNLLLDSMPDDEDWSIPEKHIFIEDVLLRTLNKQVRHFTGSGNTPMVYTLKPVLEEIIEKAKKERDLKTMKLCQAILDATNCRPDDNYVAYRKGLGVVCNKEGGFGGDDFVVEFLGEVYPAWKWFEKQDGIRSLQKNSKDTAPEFYNINLERPKGDADGYDLVVVDAMHKANYASRICHSCRPNCEAKVTAVDGYYQIGIYTVRPIGFGEEVTFDYNSVTESKEEYEASVCLCGSQVCRGSYLNLVGEGAFLKVLKEWHGLLDRHRLMLEACELNWVSEEDYIDLSRAGLGSCLLGGLPDWLIAYSARLVRFINFERTKLPDEILRHNVEEKKKYFVEICYEVEKSDAEIQAEGVYNQRLQNLALTLDKVRYVMRCAFGDPKKAPPPLRKLRPEEMVSFLWKGSGSFVEELLQCIGPHMEDGVLDTFRSKIRSHDPSGSDDVEREVQKSLVWLRDEVRNLQCTHKCRHDAAADLIHIYAYTKSFFKIREYKAVTSPPVHISPLDLGPKCADKISGLTEYRKTYGENYCLGQLIYWYNQANADPDRKLARASRGCLSLPDIGSFYTKAQKPARQWVYGPRTVRFMTARMEKQPQRPWPEDRIWSFKTSPKVFGSPMLDAVLNNSPLERDMVNWLKNRPAVYHALSDR